MKKLTIDKDAIDKMYAEGRLSDRQYDRLVEQWLKEQPK